MKGGALERVIGKSQRTVSLLFVRDCPDCDCTVIFCDHSSFCRMVNSGLIELAKASRLIIRANLGARAMA